MNKKDIRYIQAILNGMDNNAHAESDEIKEFTKRVLNAFSIQSDTQEAFTHTSGQGTTNTTQFDAVELPDDLQDPMEIVRRGKITTFQSDAVVSKSIAKEYATFCVLCYRDGLPLLELDDYIEHLNNAKNEK